MAKRNGTKTTAATAGTKLVGAKRGPRAATVTVDARALTPVTTFDGAIAAAKTVTPDTFGDALRVANNGHAVTHTSRNVCRFTRRRITDIQNQTLNDNGVNGLDDVQLLFVWCVCFPCASGSVFDATRATDVATMRAAITRGASIVNGVRAAFNRDGHGSGWVAPTVPVVRVGAKRPVFATVTPTA